MALEAPPRIGRADITRSYQEREYAIRRQALSELLSMWPMWDLENLDESWEPFKIGLLSVVERYFNLSTTNAARYYRTLRLIQGIPGEGPVIRAEFDRQKIDDHLTLLGPIFTKKGIAARRPNPKDTALVRLSGVVTAGVLDGGRETLLRSGEADPRGAGWRRVTEGTCEWCRQLAAWGAFHRNGQGWQGHTNCRCVAEPQWDGQIDDPPIDMAEFDPSGVPDGTPYEEFGLIDEDRLKAQLAAYENAFEEAAQELGDPHLSRAHAPARLAAQKLGDTLDQRLVLDVLESAADDFGAAGLDSPGHRMARNVIETWANTSGDTDYYALSLQRAAAQRVGTVWPPPGYVGVAQEALDQADALYRKHAQVLDTIMDEMYEETQRVLNRLYPDSDTVTLMRGMLDPKLEQTLSGPALHVGSKTGLAPAAGSSTGSISMNPMSSFTLDPFVAEGFGNVIMRVEVPKSRIMGTPFSGFGTAFEQEFVVLGSATEDAVSWAMKSRG